MPDVLTGRAIARGPLPQIALYAAMLSSAGLPLYIHLPRFAVTNLGISLPVLGGVLIALRVADCLQDPLLGRMIDLWPHRRPQFATLAAAGMATGFFMLFSLPPPVWPVLWLCAALALLFTSYSLASILFYGQGVVLADSRDPGAHLRIAGFREGGALAGIIAASLAPGLLIGLVGDRAGLTLFGLLLATLCAVVWAATRDLWEPRAVGKQARFSFGSLRRAGATRLLVLGFVNALPVAIAATLFVFFVEDRLGLTGLSGPFLLLFFAGAALSVPVWTALAARHGAPRVLLAAMALSIAAFIGVAGLPPGAALRFGAISVLSGAALGADMVLLPALFAAALARADLPAASGFGLWTASAKLALALAAALVLPLLGHAGFVPGAANEPAALTALTLCYAVLPCGLKLLAMALLLTLPKEVRAC